MRNYRTIGKANNLIAMSGGLSQGGKSDNNFIATIVVPAIAIESLLILCRTYAIVYIGGWDDAILH